MIRTFDQNDMIGRRVLYEPVLGGPQFPATISSGPWEIGEDGSGRWVCRIAGLPKAYADYTGRDATHVSSAALTHLSFVYDDDENRMVSP